MTTAKEFDVIWGQIEESHVAGVYIRELYWLARAIEASLDHLFANGPDLNQMRPLNIGGLMEDIAGALNAGARIRALIRERPKRPGQKQVDYEIQIRRARWLRQTVLGRLHLDELVKADMRNSLEHFDEGIDRMAIRWQKGLLGAQTVISMDNGLGQQGLVRHIVDQGPKAGATVYPLREYHADRRVFVNQRHEVDLGRIHAEASAIIENLQPLVGPEGIPGALSGAYGGERLSGFLLLERP